MCLDRSESSVVLARQIHVVLMLDTAYFFIIIININIIIIVIIIIIIIIIIITIR